MEKWRVTIMVGKVINPIRQGYIDMKEDDMLACTKPVE